MELFKHEPTPEDVNRINQAFALAAGELKMRLGTVNGCAWLIMMNAYDNVKQLPQYKMQVKKAFKGAVEAYTKWENALLYARTNRFFDVKDFDEKTRSKYKDITNRDYFDYWMGLGGAAYTKTQNEINVLTHKFELCLDQQGVKNASLVAPALTASTALGICVRVYELGVDRARNDIGGSREFVNQVFHTLSLEDVRDKWDKAVNLIYRPEKDMDEFTEKNIAIATETVRDKWLSWNFALDSLNKASSDYKEIFASRSTLHELRKDIMQDKQRTKNAV